MKKRVLEVKTAQFQVADRRFHVKDLGPLTRETRVLRGDTLEKVARQVGISVPSLSRLETSKALPKGTSMMALIRYVFGDQPVVYEEQALRSRSRQAGLRTLMGNLLEQEGLSKSDREVILDVLERLIAYVRLQKIRARSD